MKLHKESHLDHGLTARQLAHILVHFERYEHFFVETIELPEDLGTVPCALIGPAAGTPAPAADAVELQKRGTRDWYSRTVWVAELPRSRQLTVVAGPHEETCPTCQGELAHLVDRQPDPHPVLAASHGPFIGCDHCGGTGKLKHACILYTVYGGPAAPQEPDDPQCKDVEASRAFWSEHALAVTE